MQAGKRIPLVASEIAGLWNTYESDSLAICVFKHFLNHVDDKETRAVIQKAKKLSEKHIEKIESIFNEENLPIPNAFGEADVNMKAPRLFTDTFYLYYLSNMASFGIDGYSVILRYIARPDIRKFFIGCINEACELYEEVVDTRLSQGTFIKAPRVEVDKKVTFVERESFLSGLVGKPRPMIAREVTNIFSGILIDVFWRTLLEAFGQTAASTQVKDFMFKGRDLASAHFREFSNTLIDENLPVPSFSESFVTDSTMPPFSDRLMMYHTIMGCNFAVSVDGIAVTSSMRSDLTVLHTRFGAEILKFASEGMDIMIDNKWLEQPPQVVRHENLATV